MQILPYFNCKGSVLLEKACQKLLQQNFELLTFYLKEALNSFLALSEKSRQHPNCEVQSHCNQINLKINEYKFETLLFCRTEGKCIHNLIKLFLTDGCAGSTESWDEFSLIFTQNTVYSESPYIFPANTRASNLPCFCSFIILQ